jgi:hypothetical protein
LMLVCRTDNNLLKSYEEPFIIYDYQLSDIWHLEKDIKQNTTFSSVGLTSSWSGQTIELNTTYHTSSNDFTMAIPSSTIYWWSHGNDIVFNLISGSARLYRSSTGCFDNWTLTWPCRWPITHSEVLSPTTYCMSAIR